MTTKLNPKTEELWNLLQTNNNNLESIKNKNTSFHEINLSKPLVKTCKERKSEMQKGFKDFLIMTMSYRVAKMRAKGDS